MESLIFIQVFFVHLGNEDYCKISSKTSQEKSVLCSEDTANVWCGNY